MAAAGAVVRVGPKRVYIDVDGFDVWLQAQNPSLRPLESRAQAGVA